MKAQFIFWTAIIFVQFSAFSKESKKTSRYSYAPHVINDAIYEASPVKTKHDWEYGRIAKIYPNLADVFIFRAVEAETKGDNLTKNLDQDAIWNWNGEGDSASWQMAEVKRSTLYDVYIYARPNSGGSRVRVNVGGSSVSKEIVGDGSIKGYKIGEIQLEKGAGAEVKFTISTGAHGFHFEAVEIIPQKSAHRWFDVTNLTWSNEIMNDLRYDKSRLPSQQPPAHLIKGGPKGYAIITTQAIRDNSKVLKSFVEHKKKRGFKTYVVTEKHFGGGKGPDAAANIRKWLNQNYKKLDLLYVLFIGNPKPKDGDIPMFPEGVNIATLKSQIAAGGDTDYFKPTDMFYMDCSGPKLDLDGDGKYGSRGDYNPEAGGLDNNWDVLVGRIPYYGESSKHGKYSDVDAILQKTINYENASLKEIYERYNFEVGGWVVDVYTMEFAGFDYHNREQLGRGYLAFDHYSWQNNSFMDQFSPGFIRSGGHANPTFIESGVTSGWLANRSVPKDTLNVLAVYGGCDCSQPETAVNMGYMHLRYGAIATQGASRSVAGVRGSGPQLRPRCFSDLRKNTLFSGHSVGQAHWEDLSEGRRYPNGGAVMFTLYGDPSVVPFPFKMTPIRNFVIRPMKSLEVWEPVRMSSKSSYFKQEYDLQNTSRKPIKWKVTSKSPWVSVMNQKLGILKPGSIQTVKVSLNPRSRRLPAGKHIAVIEFDINGKKSTRKLHYHRHTDGLKYEKSFLSRYGTPYNPVKSTSLMNEEISKLTGTDEEKANKAKQIRNDYAKKTVVIDRMKHIYDPLNTTSTLEFKVDASVSKDTQLIYGDGLFFSVNPNGKVSVKWEPYDYAEQPWNLRFRGQTANDKNTVNLLSKSSIKVGEWNQVSLSIDYQKKKVHLFLNGELQDSKAHQGYYYAYVKMFMNKNADVDFQSFRIMNGTTTPQEVKASYLAGKPVLMTYPKPYEKGIVHKPTLKWESPISLNQITNPEYRVFLSTNPKELGQKSSYLGKTDSSEFAIQNKLKAGASYYWRVDTVAKDKKKKRTGKIARFTTNKFYSENVLSAKLFADNKWSGSSHIAAGGIAEFKSNGQYIMQEVDKSKMVKGFYRFNLTANCGEQKATRPMVLSLIVQKSDGEQKTVFSKNVELNKLKNGKLIDYFELEEGITTSGKVFMKLALPGNGGRSGYWVFAKEAELFNAIDARSVPNSPPVFAKKSYDLPAMQVKDNSYAYFFAEDVTDEFPKSLKFRMVEGPSWLTVQASGRIFSYYGAPASAKGKKHRLIVEVTDSRGQTARQVATIEVK